MVVPASVAVRLIVVATPATGVERASELDRVPLAPLRVRGDCNSVFGVIGGGEKVERPDAGPTECRRLELQPLWRPPVPTREHPSGGDLEEALAVEPRSATALFE